MPSAQRSGLSAIVGLALVVGLLLVAGTLAVSGGGILSSGGRFGVGAEGSVAPDALGSPGPVEPGTVLPGQDGPPESSEPSAATITTSFDYTCDEGAIRDLGRGKWMLTEFVAGSREGYDLVYWNLSRTAKSKAKKGSTVTMEWMEPRDVQATWNTGRIPGDRALVVTFDGPVKFNRGQTIDQLFLEPQGIEQIRKVQMFQGDDGKVRTVVAIRGDACAAMEANGWNRKSKNKSSRIHLRVERFE